MTCSDLGRAQYGRVLGLVALPRTAQAVDECRRLIERFSGEGDAQLHAAVAPAAVVTAEGGGDTQIALLDAVIDRFRRSERATVQIRVMEALGTTCNLRLEASQ